MKFKSLKNGQKFEFKFADFQKTGNLDHLVNAVCLAPAGKDDGGTEIGISDYIKFDGSEDVEIIEYKRIKK